MKDSILVYSGGMDSTTLLYEQRDRIGMALHFNYGSKHNHTEFKYAYHNAEDKLGIPLKVIDLRDIFRNFKSNLLIDGGDIPKGHYEDISMKKTVVPFRNAIMISIAVGIAESNSFKRVLLASHFGDHAIYPDCRETFSNAMKTAVYQGTWDSVILDTPYTNITKRDIALKGKEIADLDYRMTWSCYEGGVTHCGECGTCVERKEALKGFDLTQYIL
jgi:7-cyano-7-deazaguanine synthase